MRSFFAKYKLFGLVMLGISAVIIVLFYNALQPKKVLPVYQPADFNPELVAPEVAHVKKYHTIADFALVNQNGDTITQEDYRDKIYVADFFFTTCPTICPVMTDNMGYLQEQILERLILTEIQLQRADQIIVLDKGQLIEKGTHEELPKLKRTYYNLLKNQLELGS